MSQLQELLDVMQQRNEVQSSREPTAMSHTEADLDIFSVATLMVHSGPHGPPLERLMSCKLI